MKQKPSFSGHRSLHRHLRSLLSAFLLICAPPVLADDSTDIRLYTMDCGHLNFRDMSAFADTGEYDGVSGEMAVPCFLIRHPDGDLLWDSGLGDTLAENEGGVVIEEFGVTMTVPVTLDSQLAQLELTTDDIDYLAMSHLHADHAGNANLFTSATWLLNRHELSWANADPTPGGVDPELFARYRDATVEWLESDHADTLASFDRVSGLLRQHEARLIVQHAPEDFASLPTFPDFLD